MRNTFPSIWLSLRLSLILSFSDFSFAIVEVSVHLSVFISTHVFQFDSRIIRNRSPLHRDIMLQPSLPNRSLRLIFTDRTILCVILFSIPLLFTTYHFFLNGACPSPYFTSLFYSILLPSLFFSSLLFFFSSANIYFSSFLLLTFTSYLIQSALFFFGPKGLGLNQSTWHPMTLYPL